MRTASIRDLKHDLKKVTDWLSAGEPVELTRRGRPFARIIPHGTTTPRFHKPDFAAGLREIWGDHPPLPARESEAFWEDFRRDNR